MGKALLLRIYLGLSGVIFLLVALFHVLRIVGHWQILVDSYAVPRLLSWVGGPASTIYALCAFLLLWWELRSGANAVPGHAPPPPRRRQGSHFV